MLWGGFPILSKSDMLLLVLGSIGIILMPLGLWKLVEITIWCFNHIKIGIN